MVKSSEGVSRLIGISGRLLIICAYLLALAFGLLCVLYHLFATWYSSLGDGVWSGLGIALAVANPAYPASIIGLFTLKRWRARIYKPQVWVVVLLLVPIIFYLNYVLVASLGPYD